MIKINKICSVLLLGLALGITPYSLSAEKPGKAPEIRMLVAQYEKTIEFMMPEGGFWNLGKEATGQIEPGVTYKIQGDIRNEAERKYHLMVATVDLEDDMSLMDIQELYKRKGFKTHQITVGETANNYRMPANPVIHIGIDCYNDKEKAEEKKFELSEKGIKTWIYIENIRPASGFLKMSGNKQSFAGTFSEGTGYTLTPKKGIVLKKVEHSKGYSWHGTENRTYMGKLKIGFGYDNLLDCVEYTDLEEVLIGVVPSEISSKAPQDAMRSQAVAARGEILAKKGLRHVNSGYDFCSEQHCQVYKGYLQNHDTISQKIEATRGQILMRADANKILDAVYSSNCGGHSSANQNIWIGNPNPHLQGVSDEKSPQKRDLTKEKDVADYINNPPVSWCGSKGVEGASKYRWTKNLNKEDWTKVEEKANIGKIKNIKIISRDVSGRVYTMKLFGEKGNKTIMNELEIRQLFCGLKSSCFIAEFKKDKKTDFITSASFKGAGFGHGVGMCQTGAQAMASSNFSYETILKHYFPKSRLVTLY